MCNFTRSFKTPGFFMLSQNQIKHITALKVKKFREEYHQFIAEGHKLVMDLAGSGYTISAIYASAGWIIQNLHDIRVKGIPAFETLPREMDRISALTTPSQVLAVVNIPDTGADNEPAALHINDRLILALDDIRDPGNLGTIIRVADWFGIETVLLSENCVDLYNPKVVQATMGSIARVKVKRCNLEYQFVSIAQSHGVRGATDFISVYGTFLEGTPIYNHPLSTNGIIVIGNESRGIAPNLEPWITDKLFIPSFNHEESGRAESLNASIATAIVCAEFKRRVF